MWTTEVSGQFRSERMAVRELGSFSSLDTPNLTIQPYLLGLIRLSSSRLFIAEQVLRAFSGLALRRNWAVTLFLGPFGPFVTLALFFAPAAIHHHPLICTG